MNIITLYIIFKFNEKFSVFDLYKNIAVNRLVKEIPSDNSDKFLTADVTRCSAESLVYRNISKPNKLTCYLFLLM